MLLQMKHNGHFFVQCVIDYWGNPPCITAFIWFFPALSVATGFMQEVSCTFVMVCNERVQLQSKYNNHLTFQCVIDYWGTCLDAGMPGTIFS